MQADRGPSTVVELKRESPRVPRTRDEYDHEDQDHGAADDALDERELPDESDMDDSDESDIDDCPHCGKAIAEDAEWCHHCGNYLSREDAPRRVPLWTIAAAVSAVLAVLMWVMR